MDEVVAQKARHRSNQALKRAVRTWRKGDIVGAGQWALKATEADEGNPKAFHVLAMALERMGHLHKALVTYERAFQLDPEDPELLINLGLGGPGSASSLKARRRCSSFTSPPAPTRHWATTILAACNAIWASPILPSAP